nr:alpha-hydroxy-acid oxidizing protein [Candidatus Prometheoarchaeum syntrophicum]
MQMNSLEIALKDDIQYHGRDYFKDFYMVPNSLSPVSINDIDLSCSFHGEKLNYPIYVGSLTGGEVGLTKINETLGNFAKKYKIAQGIGDQIHCLGNTVKDPIIQSYSIMREKNPEGVILSNLSAKCLVQSETYIEDVQKVVDIVKANGIEIYLSPLRDVLWDKNDFGLVGFIPKLKKLIETIDIPIIIKSVSTGLCNDDIRNLWDIGVSGFNIGGVGGTSFARMDTLSHLTLSQKQSVSPIKRPLDFFGTPTVWSLLDIALRPENNDIPLIVGGGIRNGLQAVKALAMGADLISFAYPILIELTEDFGYPKERNLERWLERLIFHIKTVMALFGAQTIEDLRSLVKSRTVIFGRTKEWINGRNLAFPPKFIRKLH